MMQTLTIRIGHAALVLALGCAAPASANPTYATFDPPNSVDTYARGIASGRIAGDYSDGTSSHGFLRKQGGQIVIFDPPGSSSTSVCCINANGEIAGVYVDANSQLHGFVRHAGGGITPFYPPNGTGGLDVGGINGSGTLSGSDGFTEFFIRDAADNFTEFSIDGALKHPGGINDAGYMAGSTEVVCSPDCSSARGFIRKPNGNITQFDGPGETFTFAAAIDQNRRITGSFGFPTQNDGGYVRKPDGTFSTFPYAGSSIYDGKVTGSFQNAQGHARGFIRGPNGNINVFHVPGSVDTYAVSIWNGNVTGNYTDSNGVSHGYLRTL